MENNEAAQPLTQMPEINRERRGHNFYDGLENVPGLYETEETPKDEKIVHAHYFIGGSDWWVIELDPKTLETFGYVILNRWDDLGELGYADLVALESVLLSFGVVERDLHWIPKTLGDVLKERDSQTADAERSSEVPD